MSDNDQTQTDGVPRNTRIAALRDAGVSWLEIQQEFGLTRQQARYAYQLARRAERRGKNRKPT
jgi:hypothetical protein